VAHVGIDDLVNKNVQQFLKACLNPGIAGDVVERGECLDQAEMPVVRFASE
jgi:hypothetical protein